VALTSNSRPRISRAPASATIDPTTTPATASRPPSFSIRRSTSAGRAPIAMRMPISCVRCVTE